VVLALMERARRAIPRGGHGDGFVAKVVAFVVLAVCAGTFLRPFPLVAAELLPSPGQAAELAVQRLHLQTDLPGDTFNQPESEPQLRPSPMPAPPRINHADASSLVAELLGWLVVLIAVVALAVWAINSFPGWWKQRQRRLGPVDETPLGPLEHGAITDDATPVADEMAARGLFNEAIHQLLLDAITSIRRQQEGRLADSLTSREIVESAAVPRDMCAALSCMVAMVERCWFGGRSADSSDYLTCRIAHQAILADIPGEG